MRAAIVGLGVIGKVHAEVLAEQGIELVAVCDIDPAATEGLDCARYADFDEMMERERPDVVHICTPHWLHADMIIKALERGVNVLAEKPLCIKEEDIARILDAERASDAELGVCLQNRYNPSTLLAREILAEKRVKYAFGSLLWHRDAAYYASGDWRGKWATEGGGVLINQAIHTLDLLILTCGDPRSVTARTSSLALRDVIEVEDTVCASFGGKVPFGLYATNTAACDMPTEIRFATEDGDTVVLLPDRVLVNGVLVQQGEKGKVRGKRVYGSSHERLIADYYACLAEGRKFPVDGEEGARSVRAALGAYASSGKEVLLSGQSVH